MCRWRLVFLLAGLWMLQGCTSFSAGFARIEQEAAGGNLAGAIKLLDDAAKLDFTHTDRTLDALNRGMLLRLKGDFAAANAEFDTAKRLSEELGATSVSEQAAALVVNEGQKSYEAYPEEQLMVYAFKALNYLQSGDVEAAAVEARQFDIRQRLLREANNDAPYLAAPFVRYLNGLIYEAAGELDSARIEFQKAVEGYARLQNLTGVAASPALLADLARLGGGDVLPVAPAAGATAVAEKPSPFKVPGVKPAGRNLPKNLRNRRTEEAAASSAPASAPAAAASPAPVARGSEVLLIFHNGLGPKLEEQIIELPNPEPSKGALTFRVALPRFAARPVPVARVELLAGGESALAEVVDDAQAIARAGLDDRINGIRARAVARLVAKNAAAKKVKKKAEKKDSTEGALLSLGADLMALASERADTRLWSLLPGKTLMARLVLPPGRHTLTVNAYDAGGRLLKRRELPAVELRAGARVFVADYYLQTIAAKK